MPIRIKGLVRFFNDVRAQLQSGIPPEKAEAFKAQVRRITEQVEAICRQHRVTPDSLPAPSRNAYRFLKKLDLNNLPLAEAGEAVTANHQINLKNVVSIGDYFAAKFWKGAESLSKNAEERQKLLKSISGEVEALERICARNNATPANMAPPSQRVYCWLKFLNREEVLEAHIQSLQTVKRLSRQFALPLKDISIEIWMINMQALYRVRSYRNRILIKCNEGFLNAGEDVWQAMLQGVFNKKIERRSGALADYLASEDFSSVLFEMEALIENPSGSAKGHAHDLDASFQRVNRRYFKGAMPKPTLTWNRLLTVAKMGHYNSLRDTVMLSLSLDHPQVPQYVIDFVMYHELLHKKHGETIQNGRRFVHTPEFRTEEKQFEQYAEATDFLNRLARKQRGIPESAPAGPAARPAETSFTKKSKKAGKPGKRGFFSRKKKKKKKKKHR